MCYGVCVCLFPFDRPDPTFFTLPGKKNYATALLIRPGVVSSQLFALRRSSLALRRCRDRRRPTLFFSPGWNIIKIDANELFIFLFCFTLSNFKLSNEMRIGFQSAGCRIFQFDSLRFAFVFYRTSCCTQSWSITSFLFVFHVLNVLCYLIVVFSLFFWRRKTWETQTNKKPIFPSFSW